ncbi:MAG TPA: prolyl oligopeptidase family serine peptidase [Flavisolibacter sp.]|jgi:dipeptidyl aminopeptidase/acylaminoacyl peptidase|nr:prolyl oligopeptidase family serine peptidase [Flavisolibacter sp.]
MKKLLVLFLLTPLCLLAQKKPLDHSVYDGWQSISERLLSNNGKWAVYVVSRQEGDATLFVQSTKDTAIKIGVPRGYNAVVTDDSRYVVFKIKPHFNETREARIKKKKAEDLPKDSIGILELGKETVLKVAKVRSYKVPEKGAGWVAFHKERDPATVRPAALPTQKTVDSLRAKVDSLIQLVVQLKNTKSSNTDAADADEEPSASAQGGMGSDLVLHNLYTGKQKTFKNVSDFMFSKGGQKLVLRFTKAPRDSSSKAAVALYDTKRDVLDTILKGGNDFKNFAFSEDGNRLAFVAERDTAARALQKFYGIYFYGSGSDSAELLLNKNTPGMEVGMTVSENGTVSFSKSGNRLLFGVAPIQPAKDTSLVDFELAKLDVWHYKDDYLQSQQLYNLQNELKRSYLATFNFTKGEIVPLGSPGLPNVMVTNEGDGRYFVGLTDTGRRIQAQWTGNTVKDVYAINPITGETTLVKKGHDGYAFPSAGGKYILLYDNKVKHYFAWDGKTLRNITSKINVPLYDEDNDVPADPGPHGVMGWHQDDSAVYIYDRYDVWKVDPKGSAAPKLVTKGRAAKNVYRMARVDREERFIKGGEPVYFRVFDEKNKGAGVAVLDLQQSSEPTLITPFGGYAFNTFVKADSSNAFLYSKETFTQSPDLYFTPATANHNVKGWHLSGYPAVKLSTLNPQQETYNWGTAELYKWKTFNGKESTGIVYKPENFNPKVKYPMLVYFYEKSSDNLNRYYAPAPSASVINIPFFVSRGYIVFVPDISYTKGHPGKDAYNYVVSGAQSLAKMPWVDAKNIGIQGQSWGGYQIAHLITATNMFKAAWAGAPVVNMFSAYGGIRWQSGLNRQFQYEKTQSRIGATPWERRDLYIENSPLFHLQKVKTPVVIMANDADGAVPWYQGIEFFTAMRRLGKPIWMLNYNGEAHNLVERRNRKDITVRLQQFFDWQLKGEKPAKWITEGVPAVKKGKDWGLEVDPGGAASAGIDKEK